LRAERVEEAEKGALIWEELAIGQSSVNARAFWAMMVNEPLLTIAGLG